MHKVYVGKYLIKETDNVFAEYLRKYYDKKTFDNLSWLELYFGNLRGVAEKEFFDYRT